ncbi:hypothetical protein AB0B79_32840 [Streptomyces sp. NPDC039022]|uniref:hypothetical protein n=1 Tax=Streptomyces sp. NPDC039022 TaxID=3157091 RepID=UPI0033DDBD3D
MLKVRVATNGTLACRARHAIAVRSWHNVAAAAEFTTGAPRLSSARAKASARGVRVLSSSFNQVVGSGPG